eukprot:9954230-Alexandrium_andersonii.AAC.1
MPVVHLVLDCQALITVAQGALHLGADGSVCFDRSSLPLERCGYWAVVLADLAGLQVLFHHVPSHGKRLDWAPPAPWAHLGPWWRLGNEAADEAATAALLPERVAAAP